ENEWRNCLAIVMSGCISLILNRLEPTPTAEAPLLNQLLRFDGSSFTPPVTINCTPGNRGFTVLRKLGPNTSPGKSLISGTPHLTAKFISVGVMHPGIHSFSFSVLTAAICGST